MTRNAFRLAGTMIVAVVISGAACGGGGNGGGTCTEPASCGGDVTGDWQVKASCVRLGGALNISSCPSATLEGPVQITGRASFTPALTYTTTFTLSGTDNLTIPASCLVFLGTPVSCEQVNQLLAADPPIPSLTVHCTPASAGGCSCVTMLGAMTTSDSGTYTTSGGSITLSSSNAAPASSSYCVKGAELELTPPAAPVASQRGLTQSGTITLSRQ